VEHHFVQQRRHSTQNCRVHICPLGNVDHHQLVQQRHIGGDWLGACGLGLSRWMLLLLIGCMHRRPGLAPQVQKAPLSLALQLRGKRAYPLGLAGLSSRAARDQSGRCGANLLSGATNHLLVLTMPQKFREPNSTQCMAPAWPSRARFARAMQAEGSQETNHTQCRIAGGGRCSCTAQRGHTFSLFFF
jgi:hypothetical protein